MKPCIILENIRSAYNVWNIIRTADALWYDVILSWFTPHPDQKESVKKTSLWAHEHVNLKQYWTASEAIEYVKSYDYFLVVAELWTWSKALPIKDMWEKKIALLVWNENTWVLPETIEKADLLAHIPMIWHKESLNVGQAAAIFMRDLL